MNAKIADEARDGETQQLALCAQLKRGFQPLGGMQKFLCDISNHWLIGGERSLSVDIMLQLTREYFQKQPPEVTCVHYVNESNPI